MIAQARVVGWRARLSLLSSTTTLAPKMAYSSSRRTHWCSSAGDRGRAGSACGLRAANTGSSGGVAGWPLRWWAAATARCRTASGLRVGMPRPWRVKALRSDGQVVPSSVAAALTLPSCSASWKARSASARSARKRLGCQPTRCWACKARWSPPAMLRPAFGVGLTAESLLHRAGLLAARVGQPGGSEGAVADGLGHAGAVPDGWCRSAAGGRGRAPELEQVVGAAQQLPLGLTRLQAAAHEPPAALDGLDLAEDRLDGPAALGIASLALPTAKPGEHGGAQTVASGFRGLAVLAGLAVAAMAGRWDQQLRRAGDRRHVGDRPVARVGRQPLGSSIDASTGESGADGGEHGGQLLEVVGLLGQ